VIACAIYPKPNHFALHFQAMLSRISKSTQRILAILTQYRSPSQVAWGVALGVVLGFIPKDNLIAIAVVLVLACLRVNQLAGCITAIVLTLSSRWLQPVSLSMGRWLLSHDGTGSVLQRMYKVPMVPWTCLDNPLVVGGMLAGATCLLPTYLVCRWFLTQAKQQMESIELQQIANEAIQYRKTVQDQTTLRLERPAPSLRLIADDDSIATRVDSSSESGLGLALDSPIASKGPTDQTDVAAESEANSIKISSVTLEHEESLESTETILRETIIEVVRYRLPFPSNRDKSKPADGSAVPIIPIPTGTSMAVAKPLLAPTNDDVDGRTESQLLKHKFTEPNSRLIEAAHPPIQPIPREESLRYLLSHINGSREINRQNPGKTA
jgi:uncharacterized protein (TIGR03546 family)